MGANEEETAKSVMTGEILLVLMKLNTDLASLRETLYEGLMEECCDRQSAPIPTTLADRLNAIRGSAQECMAQVQTIREKVESF